MDLYAHIHLLVFIEYSFLLIVMTASGLVGLVQPMLWDYTPELDVEKTGKYT